MSKYDVIIRNVRAVQYEEVVTADIGIADGKIQDVGPDLDAGDATVVEGNGRLAFPGAVDAHQHWGIYSPLAEDTATESRASAQGGVTTSLTYLRTGQYYLNRGGSYRDFMPEALAQSKGRAHVDYSFHIAPMQSSHIDELEMLVDDFGVTSFKIFMFYGGHGLHGASSDQSAFLMTPPGESYNIAHFEFVMRGLQALRERRPDVADSLSLSLHCETA
ncbi:MAG: hydantoinase, partial [Ilumatobacteraceae bacterium]